METVNKNIRIAVAGTGYVGLKHSHAAEPAPSGDGC